MRPTGWVLLSYCILQVVHSHRVQRVVLTFNNSVDRSAADALVPSENVSLVKSYGRRHVLELKQPQLQLDWLYTAYGDVAPLYIEEDVALSVSQQATQNVTGAQNVTSQATETSQDTAYWTVAQDTGTQNVTQNDTQNDTSQATETSQDLRVSSP